MRLVSARAPDDEGGTYKAELARVLQEIIADLPNVVSLPEEEVGTLLTRVSVLVDAFAAVAAATGIAAEQALGMASELAAQGETDIGTISKRRLFDLVEEVLERDPALRVEETSSACECGSCGGAG